MFNGYFAHPLLRESMTELGICPAGEDVHVQLRGGELTIRVLPGNELRMTGAAETVCEGTTNV